MSHNSVGARALVRSALTPVKTAFVALFADRRSIWLWVAFALYFLSYVPYAYISKVIGGQASVWQVMPVTSATAFIITVIEFTLIGAVRSRFKDCLSFWREIRLSPTSIGAGIACGIISVSTNASYMFAGAALITMLLLTRGSMLISAPINDALQGRKIRLRTWVGFSLAIIAMLCTVAGAGAPPAAGWVIIGCYAIAYGVNMNIYGQNQGNFKFLCSAQLVAGTVMLTFSTVASYVSGKFDFMALDSRIIVLASVMGALAQLAGIFGPMILMSEVEQTYSAAVNRSGSVMAGTLAQSMLPKPIGAGTLAGVGFFIIAIIVLATKRVAVQHRHDDDTLVLAHDARADKVRAIPVKAETSA